MSIKTLAYGEKNYNYYSAYLREKYHGKRVYKGKNFNYYINDLRIEYIIELLKNDATYLNYDIKNLASLAGFTNAVNFSDNFQRKFEIKPSYFIKMMKENIKTHS